MRLQQAQELAGHLVSYMAPHCERIEIAGSIRRERDEVKDIELVLIPRWLDLPKPGSLFGGEGDTEPVNMLHQSVENSQFIQWIKPGTAVIETWPIKPGGKYWRGLLLRGRMNAPADIKVDVFLARPENWGVIFTIRTGSSDFSRALVTHARDNTDYLCDGGELITKGRTVLTCPEEETLFATLDLQYVEPRMRRDDKDIHRIVH